MDDHMYDEIMSYAECELLPKFAAEARNHKRLSDCPSYEEVKDLCAVLNLVGKYAFGDEQRYKVTPSILAGRLSKEESK